MGVMEARRRILLNQPHLVSASGNPIAFSTNFPANLAECKAAFSPVQAGSGDPSPQNIRSISGWSSCNLWRTGKNLFDKSNKTVLNAYVDTSAIVTSSASRTVCVACKPNTQYAISKTASLRFAIGYIKTDTPAVRDAVYSYTYNHSATALTITTGDGATWLVLWIYTSQYDTLTLDQICDTLQIEVASAATAYSPYSGSSYPVTFPAEAGTVYGGYVDLVNGEVWQTYKFATKTWGEYGVTVNLGSNTRRRFDFSSTVSTQTGVGKYCSVAPWVYSFAQDSLHFYVENGYAWVYLPTGTDDTLTFDLAVPLITPIRVGTLTPQQIKSFKGANTIWSDTNGNVDIKYWKH